MKISSVLGMVGLTAIAAGGVFVGTMGELDELSIDGGIIAIDEKPLEKEIAVRHLVIDGKKLRVIGGKIKADAEVVEAELGRTVEAEVAPDDSIQCSVILRGIEITGDTLYKNGSNKKYPNLPDIKDYMLNVRPVKIGNSCIGKDCYWNGMFFGAECLAVAKSSGYVLSSMQEALDQPDEIKKRILMIEGTCETPDKVKYNCQVPYGDPRAKIDGEISMPHVWAGLDLLNYAKGKSEKAVVRYTTDDYKELKVIEMDIKRALKDEKKSNEDGGIKKDK